MGSSELELLRVLGKALRSIGRALEDYADEAMAAGTVPSGYLTIAEFCDRYRLSVAMYYKLRAEGKGPDTLKMGAKRMITEGAALAWEKDRRKDGARADG